MEVGSKFFMQEGIVEGAENFPAHKTGIVSNWFSICTRRYKCVLRSVCGHVLRTQRSFSQLPALNPPPFFKLNYTLGYLVVLPWKHVLSACVRVRTAGRHGVWGVWSQSEPRKLEGGTSPTFEATLKSNEGYMRANSSDRGANGRHWGRKAHSCYVEHKHTVQTNPGFYSNNMLLDGVGGFSHTWKFPFKIWCLRSVQSTVQALIRQELHHHKVW